MTPLLKKKIILLSSVLALFGAVAAGMHWIPAMGKPKATVFRLDVSAPDAMLLSQNLSQLPRDLLAVPLLRDTLTEDFVFYYEQNEDRLGLSGSLKRLAFEHEVTLGDQLVDAMLQQPAEVALWKGPGGKLDHWLLAVRRGGTARLMEIALKLAGKDEQLQKAGSVDLEGGELQVYVLNYGRARQLFFTARGERLLAATDGQLLLGSAEENGQERERRLQLLGELIKPDAAANPFVKEFRLDPAAARHSVMLTSRYLSFGYGQLFRGMNALRFDFGEGRWSTWGQLDATRVKAAELDARALWAKAPTGAALCGSVPMNWQRLNDTLAELTGDSGASSAFSSSLQVPVAVCWYASSHYYAPLFIAGGDPSHLSNDYLQKLFDAFVRQPGADAATAVSQGSATVWRRELESNVALARSGSILLFSTDAALVDKALQVADKRYPALGDSLPAQQAVALYANPRQLAALFEGDVTASLPQESEPVFFEAASSHLLPRLKALSKYPPFMLSYPARLKAPTGWERLQWTELAR